MGRVVGFCGVMGVLGSSVLWWCFERWRGV